MTDLISSVIVGGTRTPMGRLLGSLKDLSGSDLGAIAIRGALAKASIGPELVEYLIMGQVLTAGAGQVPARQAAVAAGIPMGAREIARSSPFGNSFSVAPESRSATFSVTGIVGAFILGSCFHAFMFE